MIYSTQNRQLRLSLYSCFNWFHSLLHKNPFIRIQSFRGQFWAFFCKGDSCYFQSTLNHNSEFIKHCTALCWVMTAIFRSLFYFYVYAIHYVASFSVPSPVRNVTAAAYTPTQVNVKWRPPAEPRGRLDDIIYVIEWHTYNADGIKLEGRSQVNRKVIRSEITANTIARTGFLSTLVPALKHSHVYNIRVSARSTSTNKGSFMLRPLAVFC